MTDAALFLFDCWRRTIPRDGLLAIEDIAGVQRFGGHPPEVKGPGKSKRIKNHVLWTAG